MGIFQAHGLRWFRDAVLSSKAAAGQPDEPSAPCPIHSDDAPVCVIYASETGVAQDFADETCRQLKKIGRASRLLSMEGLQVTTLVHGREALFLASTCDDAAPPLMAESFQRQCMQHAAPLSRLHYGLLALGDRRYGDFCAFGRVLEQWLRCSAAQPLFDTVWMDNEDAASARLWSQRVRLLRPRIGITSGARE